MAKKILMVLALSALIVGAAFAQEDFAQKDSDQTDSEQTSSGQTGVERTGFAAMAKNTVVVDIGPTIVGAAIGAAGGVIGEESLSSSGFGIAAQYERQIFEKFSVAGRFAYLGGGIGMQDSDEDPMTGTTLKTNYGIDMSSFSIEGHARFYPTGGAFFLDGMLGYANMSVVISGKMVGEVEVNGQKEKQAVSANIAASQGFFKMGAKIGWRINFGRNSGFTFEPAFGYYGGIGLGDTIGQQLSAQMKEKTGADIDGESFDEIFSIIENFIFIGGPRVVLAFGWRF